MKKLFNTNLLVIMLLFFAALVPPQETKAQQFLRLDSLRFGDSASYTETTPYGPIQVDITDSLAQARIDSVKGYYVTFWGDTVIAAWKNLKTGNLDTIMVPGNGKTNTWECTVQNPRGIKLVKINDSANTTFKQTKIVLRGERRLYNNFMKFKQPVLTAAINEKPHFLRNKFYKQSNQGYSVKDYRPDKITLNDKLGIFGQMR
ncbi:MAG TPA: hypothetical protein PK605_00415 [Ignavibacteria bacterium]|nr:hypothetical protein [Bacteroidota bacterium]HRE10757.1 hypothetical protein [Ignavibacteria bacterium]HRF66001.1 hypothetical protein [Ignavibacteria bacterium]HRJ02842.1 hypothetical protein [Ignavibacteria bacterium]HRJ84400.1 hypothetical protein [Ignavibacteria bacterium]